jgi:8-oxo-dGTP diphosphatase
VDELNVALEQVADHAVGWKRRLATILRRFPWTGWWAQWIVRLWQPRHTVGVVGVLLDDAAEHVLLVEHIYHTHTPWGLPGGWIDRGEDPPHTAEREFYEETGLRVRAVCPLVVRRGKKWRTHLDVVYLCALDGDSQTLRLNNEVLGCRWAQLDDLPPLVEFHVLGIRAALKQRHSLNVEVG